MREIANLFLVFGVCSTFSSIKTTLKNNSGSENWSNIKEKLQSCYPAPKDQADKCQVK